MDVVVEITEYDRTQGIEFEWDPEWLIEASTEPNGVRIKADADGLRGLAAVLLTLAQGSVRPGAHVHLDPFVGLPKGSSEVLLERA